jgi:tRNA A37 threonylcarbamoyladenosine biosynthesis protein TsaE
LERLGQPAVLVGRRGEYALIGAILDRAAAYGAVLLLRGEAGAGKTVLLDAAADMASAAGAL